MGWPHNGSRLWTSSKSDAKSGTARTKCTTWLTFSFSRDPHQSASRPPPSVLLRLLKSYSSTCASPCFSLSFSLPVSRSLARRRESQPASIDELWLPTESTQWPLIHCWYRDRSTTHVASLAAVGSRPTRCTTEGIDKLFFSWRCHSTEDFPVSDSPDLALTHTKSHQLHFRLHRRHHCFVKTEIGMKFTLFASVLLCMASAGNEPSTTAHAARLRFAIRISFRRC